MSKSIQSYNSDKYSDVFVSRLEEIRNCMNAGMYLTALSLSLTLPDICGKAEYPDLGNNTKKRYIDWFDNFVNGYKKSTSPYAKDMPYLSGEVVYQLRCDLLHSGNPNINKDRIKEPDNKIDEFRIKYGGGFGGDTSEVSYGADLIPISRSYSLNMDLLCERLCNAAEEYYRENSANFDFFNYCFEYSNVVI